MKLREVLEKQKAFEADLIIKSFEDETFRHELLSDPKKVIEKETGKKFSVDIKIKVIEEPTDTLIFVLPKFIAATKESGELSDDKLEKVAGGLDVPPYPHGILPPPWMKS